MHLYANAGLLKVNLHTSITWNIFVEFLYVMCLSFFIKCIGGLGVACWPLVTKFAGSNPAEAVGFLGRKNPQHAFLWRGSKAVGPML